VLIIAAAQRIDCVMMIFAMLIISFNSYFISIAFIKAGLAWIFAT